MGTYGKKRGQHSKESAIKNLLKWTKISNFISGKVFKTCKGISEHLGGFLGATLGGWGKWVK